MTFYRASGVLLHPTSFPSPYGVGDLGPGARAFIDWMSGARQKLWQILPLGPADEHGSPYASLSTFAGNPALISPDLLAEAGLVTEAELAAARISAESLGCRVDHDAVQAAKAPLFERAFERFSALRSDDPTRARFSRFCFEEGAWLNDHAIFMALADANGTLEWRDWTVHVGARKQAIRDPSDPSRDAATVLEDRIEHHSFLQFLFFEQWSSLRAYARARGVKIVGDLPIYVAPNSSDVWANQSLFQLDDTGAPTRVAGVPPDYFSPTGQLWGNPLYDWDAMKLHGYAWWRKRFAAVMKMVDIVRIDHFRGFQAFWSVPGEDETAEHGSWEEGPGADLLEAMVAETLHNPCPPDWQGALPVIAEDLGLITPPVDALREAFDLPGMAVLQFAFGGETRMRPERIHPNTAVYTGTHDNETTQGWFAEGAAHRPEILETIRRYAPIEAKDAAWTLIEIAWGSAGRIAVAPLQDILGLGSQARMNLPGQAAGNWGWRYEAGALTPERQRRLAELTRLSGRALPWR